MATHSSILAWRIPWTEEPGGLQSIGVTKSRTQLSTQHTVDWLRWKESACNAGDLGSIPGQGRSLGEGNGNPLKYSCLENCMDRGAWQSMGLQTVRHDESLTCLLSLQLIYNVILNSGIQQSDSVIILTGRQRCICSFQIFFHYRLPQDTEYSSLCYNQAPVVYLFYI